ncbi:MAG: sodium:solute symporter family protein [Verrucomicrobiota bacterium]|nr:sodium:solute symporter family protein [Verrucomicrobiota bacterium]
MNTMVFICTLLGLQGICWWIGKRSSKGMETQTDYFLGGKRVPFFPLVMTFLGGQVGGGLVLGSAQEAARIGWWVLLYPLGQVLGMVWIAAGVGRRLASFGVPTVAQIFEKYYGSPVLKQLASMLSIGSLFMILVAQVLATKGFLLSVGVESKALFLLFWGLVLTYTGMGGFKAVIKTDLIQASFFVTMFGAAFAYAWFWGPVAPLAVTNEAVVSGSKLSGWLLMPLLFAALEQDTGQRCFAAKSESVLRRSAFTAGGLTFLTCLVPIYFGILAQRWGLSPENGSSVLMGAIQLTTSPVMAALVGAAIMAAILATADSLLNAISSNLSQDFAFLKKRSLNATRVVSVSIGALAIFVSFYFSNVVDLLIQAYELSVCTLVVPLLAALFKKSRGEFRSAALSIALGAFGFFLFRIIPVEFPREVGAIALSLIGYAIGEFLARRRSLPEQT